MLIPDQPAALRIGDFSRLSQVSIKALRHYDALGLLPPAHIDPHTNYRYYTVEQLPRLNRILALKDLGLALDQIAPLLDDDLTPAQIEALLRQKQAEIESRIAAEAVRLARVRARLDQIQREGALPAVEVVIKAVEPQPVLAIRQVVADYAASGALFARLTAYLRARGVDPLAGGPWLMLYFDEGYQEQDPDLMVAAPLARPLPDGLTGTDDAAVQLLTLDGVAQMVCAVHRGPYEALGATYTELLRTIATNHFHIAGPHRHVYLRAVAQGAAPDDFLTEVQVPVSDRDTNAADGEPGQ